MGGDPVFVTGGTGYIGRALIDTLLERGHTVHALVREKSRAKLPTATVAVTGHTDTVGTMEYNKALSERRAASVKAALIADGIPVDQISATGVGKSDLLVPTQDGVREPQNRRVEIVFERKYPTPDPGA